MHRLLFSCVLAICGLALLVLSGCFGSTPPTQFYLLPLPTGGDTAPPSSAVQRALTIGVGPVTVPPYLDRPQIVTGQAVPSWSWPISINGRAVAGYHHPGAGGACSS